MYRDPPRVKVYASVTQTIPGPLVQQFINFNGFEYDTAGWFDPSTDDTQVTVPTDGTYDIAFMVAIGNTATDTLYLVEAVKNVSGATIAYDKHEVNNVPNIGTRLQNERQVELDAGDRVGLRVEHGSSSNQNTIPDGALGVYLSLIWRCPKST